uniref:Si:dkey-42p14.3 n=1 Tax=Amphiprion percula TaxID=161767 RepID=A0A3P8SV43_AMPPE
QETGPREQQAADYLEKHKIRELMENLISMLFYYRPENPREFLIEHLKLVKLSQQTGVTGPNLFDDSNLDAVLGILDPTNQKYITFAQYKQGECWAFLGTDTKTEHTLSVIKSVDAAKDLKEIWELCL